MIKSPCKIGIKKMFSAPRREPCIRILLVFLLGNFSNDFDC